jgi:hypothetical protein
VVVRVAETGGSSAVAFGPTKRVVASQDDVALAIDACSGHGMRAVLLQLGTLPAPTTLSLDGGVMLPDAAVVPYDGGPRDGGGLHRRPHLRPIEGREPYQPLPSDLPTERRVVVVVVGPDGTPTATTADVVSGDATFTCEEGAAVVTVLTSAADRTGASDQPGQRPWRLRVPGFRVTQLRCTTAGCQQVEGTASSFRDVPDVAGDGGRVVAFYRASDAGGLRARVDVAAAFDEAEDLVLADDVVHGGLEVRERRIGTGPRGLLLVSRTSAGVLAWRVGPDGQVSLRPGTR